MTNDELANEIYRGKGEETRERLFESAYQLFPDYNLGGDDTHRAADYVVSGLIDWAVGAALLSYSDESQMYLVEQLLMDEAFNGLT